MVRSLTQRQILIFGGALSLLAGILTVGATFLINRIAQDTSDRLLGASARAVAERIGVEGRTITFEMPPSALGMLEDNARDNVYYSISIGPDVVSGYRDFPLPERIAARDEEGPQFRYDEYLGQRVRVATQVRRLPRLSGQVVVQIAETLDQRRELATIMLMALATLEFLLVVTAVIVTRPAVRWSLKPVTEVQQEIEGRTEERRILRPINLEQVPAELSGLVSAFNELLRKESMAAERTRRFTADASHQMRTPLAILRTHLDVIADSAKANGKMTASYEDIVAATDRLQRLLTQLLTLAQVEHAQPAGELPLCNVNEIAAEACRRFAPTAVAAGLELQFEATHTLRAPIQPLLLDEILANLFDNAAKYHECGDQIVVRVGVADAPFLSVEDNGIGIPESFVNQATSRFSRLDRDTHKPGSGLGLPIAKAICESVGATFELHSQSHPRLLVARIGFLLGSATPIPTGADK